MAFSNVKATIDIQCYACNDTLVIKSLESDSYGTVTIIVYPCERCEDAAMDTAKEEAEKNNERQIEAINDDNKADMKKATNEAYNKGFADGKADRPND